MLGKYLGNDNDEVVLLLLKLFQVKTKDVARVCLCQTQNVRLDFLSPYARLLIDAEHETRMETTKKKKCLNEQL